MKLLIVGSGGRESALLWKLSQNSCVKKIYFAPGNAFHTEKSENISIHSEDIEGITQFAKREKIDFVVIGPEAPLALGIVDKLKSFGVKCFGPSKSSSKLESSKIFTKEFCVRHSIPTGKFEYFDDYKNAYEYLKSKEVSFPLVVKADGLAAGKGVKICHSLKDAFEAIENIMIKKEFLDAGNRILIEEFLEGEEASIMAICDGERALILPTARDYKRAKDFDKGENTGGMGCLSPSPIFKEGGNLIEKVKKEIIEKTLIGMRREGNPFIGVLYAGLMLTSEGPKLLEFNVRFGDPETQVILPRIEDDLLEILISASEGKLLNGSMNVSHKKCLSVVATSKGYPSSFKKGLEINGIDEAEKEGTIVFHAGTIKKDGKIFTNGGRVLNVTAIGDDFKEAREKAYRALSYISFEGITFRNDIGLKIVERI